MSDIVKCNKCDGKGKVWDHETNLMVGLGLGYIFGKDECGRCNGVGYITVEKMKAIIQKAQRKNERS
jgi:DnaJ-class molecular chaperone